MSTSKLKNAPGWTWCDHSAVRISADSPTTPTNVDLDSIGIMLLVCVRQRFSKWGILRRAMNRSSMSQVVHAIQFLRRSLYHFQSLGIDQILWRNVSRQLCILCEIPHRKSQSVDSRRLLEVSQTTSVSTFLLHISEKLIEIALEHCGRPICCIAVLCPFWQRLFSCNLWTKNNIYFPIL